MSVLIAAGVVVALLLVMPFFSLVLVEYIDWVFRRYSK